MLVIDATGKGIEAALNDLGTSYFNFFYLNRLPCTAIKIALSFIEIIEQHKNALAFGSGSIPMATSPDLTVICEGIETAGCDVLQRYLVGKAVPGSEFERSRSQKITPVQITAKFEL